MVKPENASSSEVVMAWVNPATISKRRWNYLFQQCLHRLEKRREMSLMDSGSNGVSNR